ncbi:MAG: hypothetical protein HRU20_05780 [Pseudomonadales bacterium]|nr:hypothetical protein [Pseudomonadales bacterium]
MPELSYAALNLRFNPFGELDMDERQHLACVNIEGLIVRLQEKKVVIQFIADHGRGKTTHLLALHRHFKQLVYIKLFPDEKAVIPKDNVLFVDSIENLKFWRRMRLYRQCQQLAVTTHRDLSREMRWAGLNVVSVNVSVTSIEQLERIFSQRIEYARRGDGVVPTLDSALLKRLKNTYGDNIRAMESELYDYFYQLKGV